MRVDRISGRPRRGGDDRPFRACERIQERRLSDVRATDDGNARLFVFLAFTFALGAALVDKQAIEEELEILQGQCLPVTP